MILRTTMLFNCMYRTSIFLYLLGMRHAVLCLDDDILGQSPFQFTDADMEHYNPDRILQPSVYNTLTKEEKHFIHQSFYCKELMLRRLLASSARDPFTA